MYYVVTVKPSLYNVELFIDYHGTPMVRLEMCVEEDKL